MSLQSEDKTVLFAVGSTLVNCTNSYDVDKPDPQMVELAKYAKQHVPEEHPKVVHCVCQGRVTQGTYRHPNLTNHWVSTRGIMVHVLVPNWSVRGPRFSSHCEPE